MSFASCLFFCQLILTPVVFGILYLGWQGLVPQLAPLAKSAMELIDTLVSVESVTGMAGQMGMLLVVSFCYAMVISLPLSLLFASRE